MQSIQRPEELGFMRPDEIANELVKAFNRRGKRSVIRSNKVFVPSKSFFERLLKNWVNIDEGDNRTLPYFHNVTSFTNCNELTDEWWRLFLTNPLDKSPLYTSAQSGFTVPFFLQRHWDRTTILKAHMIGLNPFKNPDVRRIVVRERAPILIPVYNMSAALEEQLWDPNLETIGVDESYRSRALTETIVDDLCGIYEMSATLDNIPINGCTVLRNVPIVVHNIPSDNVRGVPSERLSHKNSMNVCHGGYYIILNPDSGTLTRGEHLLHFKALSVNYEIEAKVHIGVLAA
jgi:hypothetical protein